MACLSASYSKLAHCRKQTVYSTVVHEQQKVGRRLGPHVYSNIENQFRGTLPIDRKINSSIDVMFLLILHLQQGKKITWW